MQSQNSPLSPEAIQRMQERQRFQNQSLDNRKNTFRKRIFYPANILTVLGYLAVIANYFPIIGISLSIGLDNLKNLLINSQLLRGEDNHYGTEDNLFKENLKQTQGMQNLSLFNTGLYGVLAVLSPVIFFAVPTLVPVFIILNIVGAISDFVLKLSKFVVASDKENTEHLILEARKSHFSSQAEANELGLKHEIARMQEKRAGWECLISIPENLGKIAGSLLGFGLLAGAFGAASIFTGGILPLALGIGAAVGYAASIALRRVGERSIAKQRYTVEWGRARFIEALDREEIEMERVRNERRLEREAERRDAISSVYDNSESKGGDFKQQAQQEKKKVDKEMNRLESEHKSDPVSMLKSINSKLTLNLQNQVEYKIFKTVKGRIIDKLASDFISKVCQGDYFKANQQATNILEGATTSVALPDSYREVPLPDFNKVLQKVLEKTNSYAARLLYDQTARVTASKSAILTVFTSYEYESIASELKEKIEKLKKFKSDSHADTELVKKINENLNQLEDVDHTCLLTRDSCLDMEKPIYASYQDSKGNTHYETLDLAVLMKQKENADYLIKSFGKFCMRLDVNESKDGSQIPSLKLVNDNKKVSFPLTVSAGVSPATQKLINQTVGLIEQYNQEKQQKAPEEKGHDEEVQAMERKGSLPPPPPTEVASVAAVGMFSSTPTTDEGQPSSLTGTAAKNHRANRLGNLARGEGHKPGTSNSGS